MNIIVFIKQTLDTEEKITLEDGKINENGVKFILNPYDEYAVEEALQLKESYGGEVTVVAIGPARTDSALRHALAMGVDFAVCVEDESSIQDDYVLSKILAAAIKKRGSFDIILGGYMTIDNGSTQMGPRVAQELDIAFISAVTSLKIDGNKVLAQRDAEGDTENIEASLPILITAQQGLNEPRYPSLPGMMKAKKKSIDRYSLEDLGLSTEDTNSMLEYVDVYLPPKKGEVKLLEGDADEQVDQLIALFPNLLKLN